MARMRAIEAAVLILEKEGATQAFGLPGAAINPLYAAMRKLGTIKHVLARHVEGASHMAEGFTRAKAGNIGICIGTSGPAGTDMITGLYSASADSIPILCITGQAPVARLHKEDFQAVDISAIAAPVTKMAMTVLEPAQIPGAFQQAFHLMRSGRPGPVLLDLPFDVQMAEIEFDIATYEPLPVYKPAATRAQAEKALDMLSASERPVIVAGGGIINADASELLVELAETLDVPVIPTLMGWGIIPDDHRLMVGMAGLQTSHRYGNATMLESDFVFGIGNRWANRHTGGLDVYRQGRTFIHVDIEPTQIGRVFPPDYSIVSDAKAALEQLVTVAKERRAAGSLPDRTAWGEACRERKRTMLRRTHFDNIPVKPQRVYEEMTRAFGRDVTYVSTIGLSQIAGAQFLHVYKPRHWINCGQAGPLGWTIPATLGVVVADPDATVVALSGDYDFQFMIEELAVCAVQPALPARRGEQLLPRPDPAVAARLRHGLLRAARLRQRQLPRAPGIRRGPRQGRGGLGLQGGPGHRAGPAAGGLRAGVQADGRVPGAGRGRGDPGEGHEHLDGHRAGQRRRVRGPRPARRGRPDGDLDAGLSQTHLP
jgi:tartronate-semialdehyde synthase